MKIPKKDLDMIDFLRFLYFKYEKENLQVFEQYDLKISISTLRKIVYDSENKSEYRLITIMQLRNFSQKFVADNPSIYDEFLEINATQNP